ncbi:hypothetical protein GCM10010149_89340 [Nonomuraea roseoviolacea subsp. roseoviolacea]|uniref:hypothetical protein n=1 Tax=Nonomuraea roseoviolacea TaxID=103837 RepID=UPI0031D9D327
MAVKFLTGIDLDNQRAINVADPSLPTDGVNKQYADALIRGLTWKVAVRAASTTNGALATAYANGQTLDGVVLATGDRILLKNQTAGSENGIYVVNNSGAPTRAQDADSAAKLNGATVTVLQGSTNADKVFRLVTDSITLGTTALVFTEVGGSASVYVAGNGLTESPAGTFNVDPGPGIAVVADKVQIDSSIAGAGLTHSAGVINAVGGAGISVSADAIAIDTNVVARKVSANIGNGSATTIAVTHNLGTRDVTVTISQTTSPWAEIRTDVEHTDLDTVTLHFANAPSTNQYRVTVVG